MKVFKFGGASVKDAISVKNVADILSKFNQNNLIVVVSAMGKTTNALEEVVAAHFSGDKALLHRNISKINAYHQEIVADLFDGRKNEISNELTEIFDRLKRHCEKPASDNYHFEYDQIISFGEIVSTKIITAYLEDQNFKVDWIDARKVIRTDSRWREGRVDWDTSTKLVKNALNTSFESGKTIAITQGFLGHDEAGFTTTLGREGSDFTAAILAFIMDAEDVTIWKDVPGMLNADPKYFENTVLLEKISFREAIELAYFGASVIHPKTIQPLKRKSIPLYIKSFIHPDEKGSVIQESSQYDDHIPSFIFKLDQILISLTPKDFSFIVEENLEKIFGYLNQESIRINLMQNSAVSFSFCVDASKIDLEKFKAFFGDDYLVKYNEKLELVTIRHYDEPTIKRVTINKEILLEQKSQQTARMVIG
ncbi:aspartate kinase [Crocinitomix catalasitica]|uniref:aspartate kinase n=1 Tax=Crocinitomix catalasitica TaxID=184607 RepID=UPI000486D7CE|nr:aspartate kinase [Crocinitomix catalasitica]